MQTPAVNFSWARCWPSLHGATIFGPVKLPCRANAKEKQEKKERHLKKHGPGPGIFGGHSARKSVEKPVEIQWGS